MLLQIQELQLTILLGSLLIIFFGSVIIVTITKYRQRVYKHQQEKDQLQAEFSQVLLQTQLEIKEQTLQHIGRELHDNLGQVASLIKINLNTLQLQDMQKCFEKIENTKELTRQLIVDLKLLSRSLTSDRIVHVGLLKGLEGETERLIKTGQFQTVQLKTEGNMPALDDNSVIILYRVVQEVLNNIVKHSQASNVHLSIKQSENLFTLVICDDGVGFSYEEKIKNGGAGLLNMQNRAKLIRSTFSIRSSPGAGTCISIEMPLQKNVKSATH